MISTTKLGTPYLIVFTSSQIPGFRPIAYPSYRHRGAAGGGLEFSSSEMDVKGDEYSTFVAHKPLLL